MKFNRLVENVTNIFSEHENITIYGAPAAGGKTLKAIEKSLEELEENKRVLFLSIEEKPLPLYIKFIEVAKMLSEKNPKYEKYSRNELSRARNLMITELNIGMSFDEWLEFSEVVNYDTIRRQVVEFKPDLVVIDHYPGNFKDIKKLQSILEEFNARGIVTRQLNKDIVM